MKTMYRINTREHTGRYTTLSCTLDRQNGRLALCFNYYYIKKSVYKK